MTKVTSEQNGNVVSVGMPESEPLNSELLDFAKELESGNVLPENKAEAAAAVAAEDAKKAAIETGAELIKKPLSMMVGAACAKYPALVPVWPEKVVERISRAAAAVLLKHGVESGEFMSKYAEELELLVAAGEPLMVSYFIIKQAKEEQIRKTGGLPSGDDNGTVMPTATDSAAPVATLA